MADDGEEGSLWKISLQLYPTNRKLKKWLTMQNNGPARNMNKIIHTDQTKASEEGNRKEKRSIYKFLLNSKRILTL